MILISFLYTVYICMPIHIYMYYNGSDISFTLLVFWHRYRLPTVARPSNELKMKMKTQISLSISELVLPTPREAHTGSSCGMPSASAENSAAKQPPVRLLHRPPPPGVTNGSYKLCKRYDNWQIWWNITTAVIPSLSQKYRNWWYRMYRKISRLSYCPKIALSVVIKINVV